MGNRISFRREFGLILVGAIIFTASFLWKDFLTDVEHKYFPDSKGLGGRFFFVVIITIILVSIAVYLKDYFGLSTTSKSTPQSSSIKFDDEPIDENVEYESIGDYIGEDDLDISNYGY